MQSNTISLTDERYSNRKKKLGNIRTTKGKRSRTLPLHTSFRRVLESMEKSADGLVFHGPRGGKLKPDTVRNILIRQVLDPLKSRFPAPTGEIGFEHGRVHSFRHYFVSECFRQGATEAQIMAWVGHRDSAMVARYRDLRAEDGQR
ncbi:MAG: tyrosine-type recombinase/integrase, partial [Planctomycetes bacterium]|nr:tyrosine-type recombinase/integrase [Planctomycetota bacterium]